MLSSNKLPSRWQSSMEQLTKNGDYLAFKGARVTPPVCAIKNISVYCHDCFFFFFRVVRYTLHLFPNIFQKFFAKRINFDDDHIFTRKEGMKGDIRRQQEKQLKVQPREVFDGLPPGYEGLRLCIELCVLSTQYACRSASFLVLEGTCSLSDADSERAPTRFERSDVVGQLYFENGCATHPRRAQSGSLSRLDRNKLTFSQLNRRDHLSQS
ncbi:PAN domain protein [Ancylostoma duodenale]|uniref:PAN domain protein n=1 Tax=Ancylostoma duodenale TaxID=51022 RepID=A0A0C2H4Q3_9BILA|nr:PAN domain protein [Ancylostoma duodenale]